MTTQSSHRADDLRRDLLSDVAHDVLLADIMRGRFVPGERLHLDRLAEELRVSRTPVREALRRLQNLQLVTITRNSRTVVADWGAENMRQRLKALGGLAHFAVLAPNSFESLPLEDVRELAKVNDLRAFCELVTHIIVTDYPRLSTYVCQDLIAPLRVFVDPEVLRAHKVDVQSSAPLRTTVLLEALDALVAGDELLASQAVRRYTTAAMAALILPGAGIGTGSRAPRHPDFLEGKP
jgi:DNA-binding transcriptional MocR family regulator